MRFGLDEPDPGLIMFGKNGDPEGVLERCKELFEEDKLSDAAALCACLIKRYKGLSPVVHAQTLLMQAKIAGLSLQAEAMKKAADEALAIAAKHLGETSPEWLAAREIITDLKPDQLAELDMVFDVFDSAGAQMEKLAEAEGIDYSEAIQLYLKKAPEPLRVVFVLAEYLGMAGNEGLESFFLDRPEKELAAVAKYLKVIGAKAEGAFFQKVCAEAVAGADLEEFNEDFRDKNLLRLLSIYLTKHKETIDTFLAK